MDTLLQDLRYAARIFIQNPGFSALTVLCLALGIGVNSTIFSVVDTISIRPLPFSRSEQLVALYTTQRTNDVKTGGVSFPDLRDWQERAHSFADIAATNGRSLTLSDGAEPERFIGATVTWNMFPMLGISPVLGRPFRPEEDRAGAAPVVLLSYGLWQRRYAGDPSLVGRTVIVNGTPHTVIGIMPPRFQFPELAQLWVTLTPIEHATPRSERGLNVIGRLKPGTALSAARADLGDVAKRLAAEYSEDQGWSATAVPLRDDFIPSDVRLVVFTMMGAVTLVLLIACSNVANLLLARATARQREIAVRAALGAGRGRIMRQLLTESAIIAIVSAPLGVGAAYVGLNWLTASIPPQNQVPYYIDWSMNPRVIMYTVIVALATGFVFGLAPAFQAVRANLQESLRDGGRGAGGGAARNRLRSVLVVAEIALSLILLVGASLFVRSFLNLQAARAGLDTSALMTMRFYMPGDEYEKPDAMVRRVQDIVRRVEALPGVTAVMASNMVPYDGGGSEAPAAPEGKALTKEQEPLVNTYAVTPQVLRTLGVSLLAGRDFTEQEGAERSPVAIINQSCARRLWPDATNVVGRRFRMTSDDERGKRRMDHGHRGRAGLSLVHRQGR